MYCNNPLTEIKVADRFQSQSECDKTKTSGQSNLTAGRSDILVTITITKMIASS